MLVISGNKWTPRNLNCRPFLQQLLSKVVQGMTLTESNRSGNAGKQFLFDEPRDSPVETLKVRWKDRCISGSAYQETLCQNVGRKSLSSIVARITYGDLIASYTMPLCLPLAPFRLRLPCLACWRVNKLFMKVVVFVIAFIDVCCFSQNSGDYDYRAIEFVATTATRSAFSQGLHEAF